jgi:hypothetical protein
LAGFKPSVKIKASAILTLALASFFACSSLTTTRPVQEMSDTNAAIKAAKDVQADTIAPELYREASEWWRKARHEYRFKNFDLALEYAKKARKLAERAELEAIQNNGQHVDNPPDPTPTPASSPYPYPTPTGTPADAIPRGPTTTITVPPPS